MDEKTLEKLMKENKRVYLAPIIKRFREKNEQNTITQSIMEIVIDVAESCYNAGFCSGVIETEKLRGKK